ncbi:MAG: o-succinylbenzoate synthase [Flavobacteriaceae bacterium]|nr:o-succinylbenzoate synthase [Flavobacteriaceae bacterium]
MKAVCKKYILQFKVPGGTSRGILTQKETWFIILKDTEGFGIGECGLLRGLSFDDVPDYGDRVQWACDHIHLGLDSLLEELKPFPSIQFGLEQAFRSLSSKDPFELFPSPFTTKEAAIPINGLIWMGDPKYMVEQVETKLKSGFTCLKMKIGALDFDTELGILKSIRQRFSKTDIELRVDANGAFDPKEAPKRLERLAALDIHSIEQPIKAGNPSAMAELCRSTPLPIALDEELIGVLGVTEREELLQTIQPQYIILKPSFIGGFLGTQNWVSLAEDQGIGWWITSALESNIGLNAIAQFTFGLNPKIPQGLGTGGLFSNNFEGPLQVDQGQLLYKNGLSWPPNLIEGLCT